ncbi:MAG: hypothetical protein OTJ97_05110, partial [SAR202 cluster bacterium]|nr:hypothetical protein [SAR202 cluster bacterium]
MFAFGGEDDLNGMAPDGDSIAGFGPGQYNDGYLGDGDRIYWGDLGDGGIDPADFGQHQYNQDNATHLLGAGGDGGQQAGAEPGGRQQQGGGDQGDIESKMEQPPGTPGGETPGETIVEGQPETPGNIDSSMGSDSVIESSGVFDSSAAGTEGTMGGGQGAGPGGDFGADSQGSGVFDGFQNNRGIDSSLGGDGSTTIYNPDGSVYDGDSYDGDYYDGDSEFKNVPDLPPPGEVERGAIEMQETLGDDVSPGETIATPGETIVEKDPFAQEGLDPWGEPSLVDSYTNVRDEGSAMIFNETKPILIDDGYGVTPFGGPEDYQADMLMRNLPASEGFDLSTVDLDSLPPNVRSTMSEYMSDASNMSLSENGVGIDSIGLSGFMRARMFDLAGGAVLMPFFNWLDEQTGNPWASRGIQGSLATMGLVVGGDPFGALALPVMWGIQEYTRQRQRLLENDDPASDLGKKFGYVREGDKWYPAIQVSKERDEGWIGSNKTQITWQYGTQIKWRQKKGSTDWYPYFEKGAYKMKNFHIDDLEADNPDNEGGKQYQRQADPLRDFYYLGSKETDEMLHNFGGGDLVANSEKGHEFTQEEMKQIGEIQAGAFAGFKPYDDQSWSEYWDASWGDQDVGVYHKSYGAYVDQLQDLRSTLEFMQDYRYSTDGSIRNTDHGKDMFEGSRKLRRLVNDGDNFLGSRPGHEYQGIRHEDKGSWMWENTGLGDAHKMNEHWLQKNGRLNGATPEEMQQSGLKHFGHLEEQRFITDSYRDAREQLVRLQKAAGNSMHFDDKYAHANTIWRLPGQAEVYPYFQGRGAIPYVQDQFGNKLDAGISDYVSLKNSSWVMYQDGSWEFGDLDTADQLEAALRQIEESGEGEHLGTEHYRSGAQRSYLAQKAYTRYLYSKINQMGGIDYLHSNAKLNQSDADLFASANFGLDPAYSRADDANLPPGSYGNTIKHRDDYENSKLAQKGNYYIPEENMQEDHEAWLREAGFIGDGIDDPDFAAGRFKDAAAWNKYWSIDPEVPEGEEPWDDVLQQYVLPGHQSPGTHYDPDLHTYVRDDGDGIYGADGKLIPTAPQKKTDFDAGSSWGAGADDDEAQRLDRLQREQEELAKARAQDKDKQDKQDKRQGRQEQ